VGVIAVPEYRKFNVPAEIVKFAQETVDHTPFVFGDTDCVWMARRAWEISTGWDILGELVPEYSTREDAALVYDRIGLIQKQLESVGGYEVPLSRTVHGDLIFPKEPESDGFQNIALVCGKNTMVADELDNRFVCVATHLFWGLDDYVAYRAP